MALLAKLQPTVSNFKEILKGFNLDEKTVQDIVEKFLLVEVIIEENVSTLNFIYCGNFDIDLSAKLDSYFRVIRRIFFRTEYTSKSTGAFKLKRILRTDPEKFERWYDPKEFRVPVTERQLQVIIGSVKNFSQSNLLFKHIAAKILSQNPDGRKKFVLETSALEELLKPESLDYFKIPERKISRPARKISTPQTLKNA